MRKLALLILLLWPAVSLAAPTVTVTASAQSILGTTQTVVLTVSLIDFNNTGMLKAGSVVVTLFTTTSTSGTTVSVGPIYGNDVIADGFGNLNTTAYKVQVFPVTNGIIASTPALQNFYAFIGSGTIDISTATPLSPSFQSGTSGNVVLPGNLTVNGNLTLTGTFSSNLKSPSANPAVTGFIRAASGDAFCWRNALNSADLCLSTDPNDLLSWSGGSLKFTEVVAPSGVGGFDIIAADSTAHRFKMYNNGGSGVQIVASGVDINTSDQVTQLHFGATAEPLSGTAPTTGQFLQWNGSNIVGAAAESLITFGSGSPPGPTNIVQELVNNKKIIVNAHTLIRFTIGMQQAGVTCATLPIVALWDSTAGSAITSITITNGPTFFDSGVLSIALTAGHQFDVKVTTANAGCGTAPTLGDMTANIQ